MEKQNNKGIVNPKVFVSYSHDNEEHKEWVLKLSSHLINHGVDIILDQWDLRLGDNLPFFMENGLSESNLVLCICTDNYIEKANANRGGSGYEKKILSADLMKDGTQNYIIPIIRNNTKEKKTPTFLSGILYIDFQDDKHYFDSYRKLLERIFNEDIKIKPALGECPFKSDVISKNISYEIDINKIRFYNPIFEGKVSFDYKKNDGNYLIGTGEYQFQTHWSSAGRKNIHCYKDNVKRLGYNPNFTEFPRKDEISKFDFSSRCHTVSEGQIIILENEYNKFLAIKVTKVIYNMVDIDHLLEFEYKIYKM